MIAATKAGARPPAWRGRSSRGLVCHELVHASRKGAGGLPAAFQWRGQRYRIAAVDRLHGQGPSSDEVRIFSVRTTSGMRCELAHRAASDVWMMQRVLPSS